MTDSRGGGVVIAAGPTELRRYLPISVIVTTAVVGVPLWAVFGLGEQLGILATLLSVALSIGLAHAGAKAWTRWPGSRDVVFNDLMLWGFIRRIVTQRRLIRRVERLGFSVGNDPDEMTIEERTKLLKRLAEGLETGDPYTHGHSQRVARHAYMVAKAMKLPRRQTEKIRLAAVIHDVGKLRIPRSIITKPGRLTDAEFDVIKRHTIDGAAMVEVLRDPDVTDMVRHHHERLDGSGYPDKLAGDQISIGARVLAVADTFDAASSLRPYRAAQKHKVALDILEQEARAGRLDPVVVDAFVRYYSGRRDLKWWAFLSTGPAHLHELPLAFVQRVGAATLANATIVGVTAVALAPGSPLHGRPVDRDAVRNARATAHSTQAEDVEVATSGALGSGQAGPTGSTGSTKDTRRARATTSGTRSNRTNQEKKSHGKPATGDRGNAASAKAGTGGKDKDPKSAKANETTGNDAPEAAVAGAVDTATDDAPAAVGGGAQTDNSGKDSEPPTSEPVTETVTEGTDSAPAAAAPGKGKDKK